MAVVNNKSSGNTNNVGYNDNTIDVKSDNSNIEFVSSSEHAQRKFVSTTERNKRSMAAMQSNKNNFPPIKKKT